MFEIISGLFTAIISLVFLILGAVALVGLSMQKKHCSASVSGTVSAVHVTTQNKGNHTRTEYKPEFSFTVNDHTYIMKAHFGSLKPVYQEGQSVTICYDPADPRSAYVADDSINSVHGSIICLCIGLILAVVTVMLFI